MRAFSTESLNLQENNKKCYPLVLLRCLYAHYLSVVSIIDFARFEVSRLQSFAM
jgi:hypothetical protein